MTLKTQDHSLFSFYAASFPSTEYEQMTKAPCS